MATSIRRPRAPKRPTINTTWEVWTYDVWGNAKDGYDVNDRSCHDRAYPLTLDVETFNDGTPQAFDGAFPSDKQIREAFGVRCRIGRDGGDLNIYVYRDRDRYPIGELSCTSHASLSPIRPIASLEPDVDDRDTPDDGQSNFTDTTHGEDI